MRRLCLVGVAALAACATDQPYTTAGTPPPPPADLPAEVRLESPTEDFTHEWYVALRGGRLWMKPNRETTGRDEPWRVLPPDGFAHHRRHDLDGAPPSLRAITADGDNLVAIGEDGLVHYLKFHDLGFIDHWGLPPFGEALFVPGSGPAAWRSLAMSHRGPLVEYYEDIDGNRHPMTHGVTTLYRLSADGSELSYADPWLPAHWNRRICLPEQGRFLAAALSASASTLFVIDEAGQSYTRLADYDTIGDNPVLGYSWEHAVREDGDRTLPGEGWIAQPPLPGRVTARITVLQTGPGNAGRELRVEGVDEAGAGGYFVKALRAPAWRFVPTGAAVAGPFLGNGFDPAVPAPPPSRLRSPGKARELQGTLQEPELEGVTTKLVRFDPACSPAALLLDHAGVSVELPLHLIDLELADDGSVTGAEGALLAPVGAVPAALGPALAALLGREPYLEIELTIEGGVVELEGDPPGLFRSLDASFR